MSNKDLVATNVMFLFYNICNSISSLVNPSWRPPILKSIHIDIHCTKQNCHCNIKLKSDPYPLWTCNSTHSQDKTSTLTLMFWISEILWNARYLFSDNFYFIKHAGKISSVFGGHIIFINLFVNFPCTKWEGYYAYSSIVEGFLHL